MKSFPKNLKIKTRTVKFIDEFRTFSLKGNILDLAIGVIIGGAFGKIVTSLVNDIIMPPIGWMVGGVNFTDLKIVLKEAVGEQAEVALRYGNFFQVTFDFLIIAFSIFIILKLVIIAKKRLIQKQEQEQEKAKQQENRSELLLTEIRDLLKAKK